MPSLEDIWAPILNAQNRLKVRRERQPRNDLSVNNLKENIPFPYSPDFARFLKAAVNDKTDSRVRNPRMPFMPTIANLYYNDKVESSKPRFTFKDPSSPLRISYNHLMAPGLDRALSHSSKRLTYIAAPESHVDTTAGRRFGQKKRTRLLEFNENQKSQAPSSNRNVASFIQALRGIGSMNHNFGNYDLNNMLYNTPPTRRLTLDVINPMIGPHLLKRDK